MLDARCRYALRRRWRRFTLYAFCQIFRAMMLIAPPCAHAATHTLLCYAARLLLR